MVPIGFVSDHMEVLYDLDTEADGQGRRAGPAGRAARPPSAPTRGSPPRSATWSWSAPPPSSGRDGRRRCALGALGPSHDLCPVGCCPARAPRPAAAGADSPYAVRSTVTAGRPTVTDAEGRTARPRPGGRPPRGRPAARRPPGRPRRGRDQVQPDRRRHRDGHRRREADHRPARRAPPATTASSARRAPASRARSGVRWVIDPLDGTVNYLYGLPTWAVSIAAEQDGETRRRRGGRPRCAARRTTRSSAAGRVRRTASAGCACRPRRRLGPGPGRHRLRLRRRAPRRARPRWSGS